MIMFILVGLAVLIATPIAIGILKTLIGLLVYGIF